MVRFKPGLQKYHSRNFFQLILPTTERIPISTNRSIFLLSFILKEHKYSKLDDNFRNVSYTTQWDFLSPASFNTSIPKTERRNISFLTLDNSFSYARNVQCSSKHSYILVILLKSMYLIALFRTALLFSGYKRGSWLFGRWVRRGMREKEHWQAVQGNFSWLHSKFRFGKCVK